jgi:hypothetical protein
MRCEEHRIEHRLTKIRHPWSPEDQKTVRGTVFPNGGQVARMRRKIKDATVKRFHYDDHDQLRRHLADFVDAYNFGRRLKTLRGLTPYEFIVKCWTSEPERFRLNPTHQMPGLNTPRRVPWRPRAIAGISGCRRVRAWPIRLIRQPGARCTMGAASWRRHRTGPRPGHPVLVARTGWAARRCRGRCRRLDRPHVIWAISALSKASWSAPSSHNTPDVFLQQA